MCGVCSQMFGRALLQCSLLKWKKKSFEGRETNWRENGQKDTEPDIEINSGIFHEYIIFMIYDLSGTVTQTVATGVQCPVLFISVM